MFEPMEMDWKFWIFTIIVLLLLIHVAFSELREFFVDHDSFEAKEKREAEMKKWAEREAEEDDRYGSGKSSYYK